MESHSILLTLGIGLFSFSTLLLRFIYIVACTYRSFLYTAEEYSMARVYSLPYHSLKDTWIISSLCLLQITLLWTLMFRFLCEHAFIIWDNCLGMIQLLDSMVVAWLVFPSNNPLFYIGNLIWTIDIKYHTLMKYSIYLFIKLWGFKYDNYTSSNLAVKRGG